MHASVRHHRQEGRGHRLLHIRLNEVGSSREKATRGFAVGDGLHWYNFVKFHQEGYCVMIFQEQFTISTSGHRDMRDLTEQVARIVARSQVRTGVVHVFNIGSTAAVGTIEFEPGLQQDLPDLLDRLMPPSRAYGHEQAWHDGNGHSHLQATVLGSGLTVPVGGGQLLLGTWQQIFHLECDIRPRQRTIVVTVLGG